MGNLDRIRRLAEECLEKAKTVPSRQGARSLLVQAHNFLKTVEETEAQQLKAD
jgi:hypothetical protein